MWPLAGPLRGGTEVEIQGYDLGKKFADIRNSVTVAGHPCYPDHKKYQPSKRYYSLFLLLTHSCRKQTFLGYPIFFPSTLSPCLFFSNFTNFLSIKVVCLRIHTIFFNGMVVLFVDSLLIFE